jgi:hypothetical protein
VSSNPAQPPTRRDRSTVARWRRLSFVALALVVASTALLTTMLRVRSSSDVAVPSASDPATLQATSPKNADSASQRTAEASGAPQRPRSYSPVDVSTLAAARAYGDDAGSRPSVSADVEQPALETALRDAPPSVAVSSDARAPDADAAPVSPPAQARSAPPATRPAAQPAKERTRAVVASARAPTRRADTRTDVATLPDAVAAAPEPRPAIEPPRPSAALDDAPQRRQPAAAATELDAAWDRREQWMRERLRQR